MTSETLTPSRLWRRMTLEQRQRAARAFWADEEATDDQVQAALVIAQQKKFRPKTVIGLDLDRKARHLATIGALPDGVAARALVIYHLAEQRAMMGDFLDALGITHDNGVIKEENVKPEAAKLRPAIDRLKQKYSEDDVTLYLTTLVSQDPETWAGLQDLGSGQG